MSSIVRNLLAGLSAREKKMVAAMSVTAVLMICFLTAFFVGGAISDLERDTAEWTELIGFVKVMESHFKEKKLSDQRMEKLGKPKPLRTLVDNVIKKTQVTEADTKELNDKTYPGGWLERSAEVTFREIDLQGIVKFMKEVEQNKRTFPIAISKLNIRKQRREEGMFRVSLTISTYEKVEELATKTKGKGEVKK
ncbi:MAG: hypothetical protein JXX29_17440 [Deltaproteobacteria bacterium]|nr:hypothetical protein [Deltaproteobacteria bacterium]MBN2673468.1 hypothetical protein [Deltaproteobacteria bacterium]